MRGNRKWRSRIPFVWLCTYVTSTSRGKTITSKRIISFWGKKSSKEGKKEKTFFEKCVPNFVCPNLLVRAKKEATHITHTDTHRHTTIQSCEHHNIFNDFDSSSPTSCDASRWNIFQADSLCRCTRLHVSFDNSPGTGGVSPCGLGGPWRSDAGGGWLLLL